MESFPRVALIILAVVFVAWLLYDWSRALNDRCKMVRKLEKYNEAFPTSPWIPNYPKQPSKEEKMKNKSRVELKPKSKDKYSIKVVFEVNEKLDEEKVLEVNEKLNEEKVLEVNEKVNEKEVLENEEIILKK